MPGRFRLVTFVFVPAFFFQKRLSYWTRVLSVIPVNSIWTNETNDKWRRAWQCGSVRMRSAAACTIMAGDGAITAETLKEKLRRELQAEHVEVEDTSPNHCSTSFKVIIVSPQFEGKALLQRHRLVNSVLAEELKIIHAFEQKTLTPAQWEQEKQK
ncbi:bolA-like protein 2 [Dendropsophus ebraccatus]|uniref:bolA-like protein 2 n=1 Tax=Dendropsophus ebraccatus TaxID=150705 RepID=UPI0038322EDB